jgi:eukaryotic-like serine/threonine-protein kinase
VSELFAGLHITPSIRLVRPFGAGGMGTVWIAEHLTLRCEVVVKFMADGADDPQQVARFSREAAAASRVRSPHVVQVFDHGFTESRTPYIVMELLDGEDLSSVLTRRGHLPLAEVLELIVQVSLALGRAHAAEVVHRDIKPANIFVCDRGDGRPFYKVLDFGIAKRVDMASSFTMTGAVVGTPGYSSPEQLVGSRQIDHRSDLWSLGVVAFKALTGRLPFTGTSGVDLALAIQRSGPPRPSDLEPGLPPSIDRWFARAFALSAEGRFGSAQEMANAFADAARGGGPDPAFSDTLRGPDHAVAADLDSTLLAPSPHAVTARLAGTPGDASNAARTAVSGSPVVTLPLAPTTAVGASASTALSRNAAVELTEAPSVVPITPTFKAPLSRVGIAVGVLLVALVIGGLALFVTRYVGPKPVSTSSSAQAEAPSQAVARASTQPVVDVTPAAPSTASVGTAATKPLASSLTPRVSIAPRSVPTTAKPKEAPAPTASAAAPVAPEPNGKLF